MMTWVDQTLAEFGRSLGVGPLSFDGRASIGLRVGSVGDLILERTEREVLVALARDRPPPRSELLRQALELCHERRELRHPVHAGLQGGDRLVLLTRLPREEFTLTSLGHALEELSQIHGQIR
jgi:type III secretion system chaperone SycN